MLGAAPNLALTPDIGAERWCFNNPRAYRAKGLPAALTTWTRWFNLHSTEHIYRTYPSWWAQTHREDQGKPVFMRDADLRTPGQVAFPGQRLLDWCGTRFFTFSLPWALVLAWYEHTHGQPVDRIDLWGFELRRTWQHAFERPCCAYWVERMRAAGIEVWVPPGVEFGEPGDPTTYVGPLYGYETTKPVVVLT
jgi:hypothetical protein